MIDSPRTAPAPETAADAPRYHIDTEWYTQQGLDYDALVRGRMCDMCRAKLGQEIEERIPVFDKDTGRPRFEVRKSTYGSDPLKVIREHCGRAKSYISRDMPTLEAMFRVYLANGNTPMTLEQVRDYLAEWCPGGGCQWLLLPIETLHRLIQNDTFYGLRPAPEGA